MKKRVLILGRLKERLEPALEAAREKVGSDAFDLIAGTNLDDVRAAFADGSIEMVIMGAGLTLDLRLKVVEHVFTVSEGTTVHMKDFASGPTGMIPFVVGVLESAG